MKMQALTYVEGLKMMHLALVLLKQNQHNLLVPEPASDLVNPAYIFKCYQLFVKKNFKFLILVGNIP